MPSELPPAVERALGRAIMGLPRWIQRPIAGRPIRRDGIQLETEVQVMLRLHERFGGPEYDELDVAEARATLAADAARAGGRPIPLAEVGDLDAGGVAARLYVPAAATAPGPLLVYFHGGGHVLGDVDTHDSVCRWLARETRIRLLAVEYRLAPEHPFPAAVDDALAGFRFATAHAAEIGADPARVAVGGDRHRSSSTRCATTRARAGPPSCSAPASSSPPRRCAGIAPTTCPTRRPAATLAPRHCCAKT